MARKLNGIELTRYDDLFKTDAEREADQQERVQIVPADRINENTTEVRHVKPYLLTALYNAPLTMDNHYALMVGHDLSGGSG